MLTFRFTGVDGCMVTKEKLTSGMVGKEVRLEFSSDWDGLVKTAVFTAGKVTRDVVDVSDVVIIPADVLAVPTHRLYVGIYGVSQDGNVTPTIRAQGPEIEPGADPSGDEGIMPELPVWAQLQLEIDALKEYVADEESGTPGQNGDDGATFIPAVSAEGLLTWTNNKGLDNPAPVNIKGPQGETGATGEQGEKGERGEQGEKGEKGDTGATGSKGADGSDGVSPTLSVSKSGKVTTVTITDADGTKTATIYDGADGQDAASSDAVPSYWQTALDEGSEAINTALCEAGRNKSAFLFYSDTHWNFGSQMSPALLKYLHRHSGMTKTFFGGDIVNDEATDYNTMEYLWEWRKQLKDLPNHHSVPGNHDDGNNTNNLFSQQYIYGYLQAAEETPDVVRGDDGLYYYIDCPAEKTRYLCLDTGYRDLNSLSVEQETFINESLASTPAGWHIVVISHIWFVPDYDQSSVRPIPIVGLSDTAASVAAILDSYNARSGIFAECGATVEFCIGGHVHRDYTGTTDGGIPIIIVETDSQHIRSDLTYTAGTTDEASVNGIIADYDNDLLTVVRVGRGNGFTINLSTGESTETPGDGGTEPAYTNILDTVGYQTGYRFNSSGVATARSDRSLTGFINAAQGDIVYFKNITTQTSDYGCNVAHYTSNSESAFITGKAYVIASTASNATWWEDGSLKSFTVTESGTEWLRFCFVSIDETSIITVNEPIG